MSWVLSSSACSSLAWARDKPKNSVWAWAHEKTKKFELDLAWLGLINYSNQAQAQIKKKENTQAQKLDLSSSN